MITISDALMGTHLVFGANTRNEFKLSQNLVHVMHFKEQELKLMSFRLRYVLVSQMTTMFVVIMRSNSQIDIHLDFVGNTAPHYFRHNSTQDKNLNKDWFISSTEVFN